MRTSDCRRRSPSTSCCSATTLGTTASYSPSQRSSRSSIVVAERKRLAWGEPACPWAPVRERLDLSTTVWRIVLERDQFSVSQPPAGRHHGTEEQQDPREPQGGVRRREPGQPPLPLLRQRGGRGAPSRH